MQIRFDDRLVAQETFAPGLLEGTGESLLIGGIGPRPACGGGINFDGAIDEVSVSRIARHMGAVPAIDAGIPDAPGTDVGPPYTPPAGCCDARGPAGGPAVLGLLVLAAIRRRRTKIQPAEPA
jgi:hypothetical protein